MGQFPSAGYFCMELLPMAVWTLSRRAGMVLRRQMPLTQVRLLKNSTFDLMTRSVFIASAPAVLEQSTPCRDTTKTGNPSSHCDPPRDRRRQPLRLWGRDTRWGGRLRRAWPSWDTGRCAAAQAGAARFRPALLAHRVRRPTRRRGPGALPPARTNAARQRDSAACATGWVAPDRFGSRTGNRAFDRGAVIAIPRRPPMDRHTGSGRFARPGRRRP